MKQISPYRNLKGQWIPSSFQPLALNRQVVIETGVGIYPSGNGDWEVTQHPDPITYTIIDQIGDPGAQGEAYIAQRLDQPDTQYVIKQMIPGVELQDRHQTYIDGACTAYSIGFSLWKPNGINQKEDPNIQRLIQLRNDEISTQTPTDTLLPLSICNQLFINEVAYSVLFGHLGVSPTVYGFDLKQYCLVLEKLDKTLNKLKTPLTIDQWQRIFDIQAIVTQQNVLHNDPKPNNYMMDTKNTIYLIDWGAATHISSSQKKYPYTLFPSALKQWVPREFIKRYFTWNDLGQYLGISV